MLQACLNGDREKGFHAGIPLTASELAADARAVVDAGARELHIHPRDAAGRESLHPDDTAGALEAIRASVPGIPVGASTGWWIVPHGRARQQHIRAWQVLPDYVSVNLIEEDAIEVIDLALQKGIGIEAGLWSPRDAEKFVTNPNARNCLRVLIEINEQDFLAVQRRHARSWKSSNGPTSTYRACFTAWKTRCGRSTAKRFASNWMRGSGWRTGSSCRPARRPKATLP